MKLDLYKEKISYYKLLITLSATAMFGCISWSFLNAKTASQDMLLMAWVTASMSVITFGAFIFKARFYLKKLENKTNE